MAPAQNSQVSAQPRTDAYWSIVSDLVSLIERTHGYQWVNETPEQVQPADGDVIVLDDMRPTQTPETLLMTDCNLRLREALHFLLEARAARKRSDKGFERSGGAERRTTGAAQR